jgi:hypothetical protein
MCFAAISIFADALSSLISPRFDFQPLFSAVLLSPTQALSFLHFDPRQPPPAENSDIFADGFR